MSNNINAGSDFIFMDEPFKIVYECGESSRQALVILPDAVEHTGKLGRFIADVEKLFTGLEVEDYEKIHTEVTALLNGPELDGDNEALFDEINITIKQFFIHITIPAEGKAIVEYAFGLRLDFENGGKRRGLIDIFKLNSLFLNLWNVSPESKIYQKMGIETIEELLE